MKLGIFMMPVHPLHRSHAETLKEDRETVILADQLGYHDAFIGEHLTDKAENITNSLLFLATLIHSTKRIKLASGTCNLSQIHPTVVAANAAMFDHLAEGRFILGVSPGALVSDAEALGILDEDRNKMFSEAIDVILEIWSREPPYEIDLPGNRFKVTTRKTMHLEMGVGIMPKPYQKPRPEIVGTVVAPFSKGVVLMGERDFHPLSANFLLPHWLKTHWANYAEGKTKVGVKPDPAEWRVARSVFVADDDKVAASYGRHDANSPYRFYYKQLQTKLTKAGRHAVFKERLDQPDHEITYEFVLDRLCIYGTVNKVVDQILALRELIGDFGELVYAGMDWADSNLAKRSMQLIAEQVMPRVNAAIAKPSGLRQRTGSGP
jgi:alkanesulfonate monooxygenase SsuD/methylene tetrahydromethanopterin reductase-like flavin-dependent oxidoreductase (luciferase family)